MSTTTARPFRFSLLQTLRSWRRHDGEQQLAVMIDGDNVPANCAGDLFLEINRIGIPVATRIYGNFIGRSNPWAPLLKSRGGRAIMCCNTANKKNSADITLVVDAMHLLYCSPKISGFCLVSSDADLSPLAVSLLEHGKSVYVFGSISTPEVLRRSSTRFKLIEELGTISHGLSKTHARRWHRPTSDAERVVYPALMSLGGGHQSVSAKLLGRQIRWLEPGFDVRDYRCPSLPALLKQLDLLEVVGDGEAAAVSFRHPLDGLEHSRAGTRGEKSSEMS